MPGNNNGLNGPAMPEISKTQALWMRKMVFEVNKFPYSNTKNLGLYEFSRKEFEWYYEKIRMLTDSLLNILECPHCGDTIQKAVLPRCGCSNPLACCSKCWLGLGLGSGGGSTCVNCRQSCSALPLEQVDEIIRECHLFLKEKALKADMRMKEIEVKRIRESYHHFLKQTEMLLMCNYCFGTLENTMLGYYKKEEIHSQVCQGCHEYYIDSKICTDYTRYPTFDLLNGELQQFFSLVLSYCSTKKSPVYKDPYPDLKQPSMYKKKVMQRGTFTRKLFDVFKKAVVVAACAYVVSYFVH